MFNDPNNTHVAVFGPIAIDTPGFHLDGGLDARNARVAMMNSIYPDGDNIQLDVAVLFGTGHTIDTFFEAMVKQIKDSSLTDLDAVYALSGAANYLSGAFMRMVKEIDGALDKYFDDGEATAGGIVQ